MTEMCFNLFVYANGPNEIFTQVGVAARHLSGTDAAKLRHLQLSVADDFATARRFPVPDGFGLELAGGEKLRGTLTWDAFRTLWSRNLHLLVFEPAFKELAAPQNPLVVLTAVVDGKPRVDGVVPAWKGA